MLDALQTPPLAAWDDVSSAKLDPLKVIAAGKLEMEYAEKKAGVEQNPRKLANSKGWEMIKSRWLDINQGDEENPNYRSRFVGKEFTDREIEGLFAATPPLEALRLLLSWAATSGTGPKADATPGRDRSILIADVSRAFFEAPARRDVCVELLEEALAEGESAPEVVGKLEASLYGTRDASANWQDEVKKCMKS